MSSLVYLRSEVYLALVCVPLFVEKMILVLLPWILLFLILGTLQHLVGLCVEQSGKMYFLSFPAFVFLVLLE